jgi:hypothetical protein
MIASSGNGITERKASYDTDSHEKGDTGNNNAEDVIGSLLAGVSLSTSSYSKDDLGVDWSSPAPSCNDIHHRAKASTVKSNIGNGGQRVPSRTQLLFGTDIQDLLHLFGRKALTYFYLKVHLKLSVKKFLSYNKHSLNLINIRNQIQHLLMPGITVWELRHLFRQN